MEKNKLKFNVIDKSIAQRAVIIGGLIFEGRIGIDFGDGSVGEDIKAAIGCIEDLRAGKRRLYAGNSATALRLIVGAAVGLGLEIEIEGDESLNNRCMRGLVKALGQMNARAFGVERDGKILPPIRVERSENLKSIHFDNKSLSAQIKSAVLLSSFFLKDKSTISERVMTRNHTEIMLEYLSRLDSADNAGDAVIKVPYDISSAAFLIALKLLKKGNIVLDGIGINPTRLGFIKMLKKSGFDIKIKQTDCYGLERVGRITAKGKDSQNDNITPIYTDRSNLAEVIDEIPILCITASFIKGESVFKDLGALRNKESDRVTELYDMLKSFGVRVELRGDELKIRGSVFDDIKTPVIVSKDHRIIMAASVMGELLNGVKILYPECVKVSYPNFFEDIKAL